MHLWFAADCARLCYIPVQCQYKHSRLVDRAAFHFPMFSFCAILLYATERLTDWKWSLNSTSLPRSLPPPPSHTHNCWLTRMTTRNVFTEKRHRRWTIYSAHRNRWSESVSGHWQLEWSEVRCLLLCIYTNDKQHIIWVYYLKITVLHDTYI